MKGLYLLFKYIHLYAKNWKFKATKFIFIYPLFLCHACAQHQNLWRAYSISESFINSKTFYEKWMRILISGQHTFRTRQWEKLVEQKGFSRTVWTNHLTREQPNWKLQRVTYSNNLSVQVRKESGQKDESMDKLNRA